MQELNKICNQDAGQCDQLQEYLRDADVQDQLYLEPYQQVAQENLAMYNHYQ